MDFPFAHFSCLGGTVRPGGRKWLAESLSDALYIDPAAGHTKAGSKPAGSVVYFRVADEFHR
jgi:hypothetical protein